MPEDLEQAQGHDEGIMPEGLAILGLLFNGVGVSLLLMTRFLPLPNNWHDLMHQGLDRWNAANQQQHRQQRVGLWLLGLGFILQLLARLWPYLGLNVN